MKNSVLVRARKVTFLCKREVWRGSMVALIPSARFLPMLSQDGVRVAKVRALAPRGVTSVVDGIDDGVDRRRWGNVG